MNIDNKIFLLSVWHYISKLFCSLYICVTSKNIWFAQKQFVINWQLECQISVKYANASNSYSGFGEVTQNVHCKVSARTCRPDCQTARDKFLALYSFSCLNSSFKTRNTIVCRKYHFLVFFTLFFTLIASTNVASDQATAVCRPNPILVTQIFCCRYSTVNNCASK